MTGTRDDEVCALALVKSSGPMTVTTFQPGQRPLGAVVASADLSPEDIAYGILRCMPKHVVLCGLTQLDPKHFPRPNENSGVHTLNYIETARITIDGTFANYWDQRG